MTKFEKVSYEQFAKDYFDYGQNSSEVLDNIIKLPTRATTSSAGYDFVTPFDIDLEPGESMKIPTGIKCQIDGNYFLGVFPKSGLGFKYSLRLCNTVGIIDADYFNNSDNEGHIWVKIQNDGVKPLHVDEGKAFCQGIFLPYGITDDDNASGIRNGGLGSTNA